MKFLRSTRARLAAAAFLAAIATPAAADYPDRPITAVVPFDVGGATDILARMMSAELSNVLKQNIAIVNKPGAGAIVGTQFTTMAKPDGYTILFSGTAAVETPAMYNHLPFDPLKDIRPVSVFAEGPFVIAISTTKVPSTNLKDFIAYMKANPGKLNAASGGSGTTLSVQLFLVRNSLTAQIVPYKSAGAAITALGGGETDFSIPDAAPLGPFVQSGKVRILAVAAEQRLDIYPDVPTTAEAGLPGYIDGGPSGLYVHSATSSDIVQKLHDSMRKVIANPTVVENLRKIGWKPRDTPLEQNASWYREQIQQWKDVVAKGNIPKLD